MRLDKLLVPVLGLLVFTTVGARADTVRLEWSAPHGCPRADEVRARVNARARAVALATDALSVRAVVRQEPAGFRLSLSIEDAGHHAERELVAPSCAELVDALAWLVTIGALRPGAASSVDGSVATSTAAPSAEAAPTPPEPEAQLASSSQQNDASEQAAPPTSPVVVPAAEPPRVDEPPRRRPRPRRTHPWWYRAAVGAGVWSNDLPGPQAQLAGGLGVGVGLFLLELRFSHLFARAQGFADDRTVRVRGEALSALGCALFPAAKARVRVGPCLSVTGLYSVADARGIASPERGTFFSVRGGVAGQAALRVRGWLELIAEAGLGLPLGARPGFTVAGYGEVARASRLSAQTSFGLGATW